ncbi:MAG: DUF2178 domain-containing protein [Firmicutes bacterium]|nr:DUF2178 domain-containing protein [Bacillota bacterium]
MKRDKRMIFSIIWLIAGAALIALAFAGKVDEFWNSFGFALAIVGALQLLRFHRFQKNPAYREKMEIAESDERNHFIRNKAWAWAGYIFVLTMAVAVIVFRLMGYDQLSFFASMTVCLMLVLYWGAYMILQRKY